jgi:predicted nucleic acid-binding protein
MKVADTDVLIDFLRGAEPAASRVAEAIEARAALAITTITRFELLAGARGKRQRAAVEALLAALPALPLDTTAADRAAGVRRELESRGDGIGMADSLIAGIVLTHGAQLLTRNRRHFERVPDLAVVDLA